MSEQGEKIDWNKWVAAEPKIDPRKDPERVTLTPQKNGTIAIGITSDLVKKLDWEKLQRAIIAFNHASPPTKIVIAPADITGKFRAAHLGRGDRKGIVIRGFRLKSGNPCHAVKAFCEFTVSLAEANKYCLVVDLPRWAYTQPTAHERQNSQLAAK